MANPTNEHEELLIIKTKLDALLESNAGLKVDLSKFASRMAIQYTALEARTRELEKKSVVVDDNRQDIRDLQAKSNILDVILGIGTVVGAIIGAIFGNRQI